VGTGHSHTLNELYAALADILGFKQKPNYGPTREGDVQHSLASIERASGELGYKPQADFHAGLEKTVAWYVEEHAKSARA
jgi:nucleoside-diphosphate-sugar epimerase